MNLTDKALTLQLDAVIAEMKQTKQKISDDRQPPSLRELEKLQALGTLYGEISAKITESGANKKSQG